MSVPPDFGLELDRATRRLDGGRALLGGEPLRLLRLSAAGAALVERWRRGGPVGAGSAGALARRLLDGGLAHPRPPAPGPPAADVDVVIPVRDDTLALERCLASVGTARSVIVIDDGSRDADAVRGAADRHGARVVRRAHSGGPAAARNEGLRAGAAPLVAFLDSDCEPAPDWLATLLPHLADEQVAAVAPRVRSAPGDRSALHRYEAARSPLDLGPRPGRIAPGTRIAYVPAAALLVRREAVGAGFDERLRYGEDVDLLWRLHDAGWRLRYEPRAQVRHAPRPDLRAWLAQRAAYGSSAAALARRHPGRLAPLAQPLWTLAPALALLAGARRGALLGAAGLWLLSARRLTALPPAERAGAGARLAGRGVLHGARALAEGTWRAWLPLALPLATRSPRARRALVLAAAAPALAHWVERRPALDPLRWTALHALDDGAYAAGVWLGCARAHTLAPLIPRLTAR